MFGKFELSRQQLVRWYDRLSKDVCIDWVLYTRVTRFRLRFHLETKQWWKVVKFFWLTECIPEYQAIYRTMGIEILANQINEGKNVNWNAILGWSGRTALSARSWSWVFSVIPPPQPYWQNYYPHTPIWCSADQYGSSFCLITLFQIPVCYFN